MSFSKFDDGVAGESQINDSGAGSSVYSPHAGAESIAHVLNPSKGAPIETFDFWVDLGRLDDYLNSGLSQINNTNYNMGIAGGYGPSGTLWNAVEAFYPDGTDQVVDEIITGNGSGTGTPPTAPIAYVDGDLLANASPNTGGGFTGQSAVCGKKSHDYEIGFDQFILIPGTYVLSLNSSYYDSSATTPIGLAGSTISVYLSNESGDTLLGTVDTYGNWGSGNPLSVTQVVSNSLDSFLKFKCHNIGINPAFTPGLAGWKVDCSVTSYTP